jgi:hypothetical protein
VKSLLLAPKSGAKLPTLRLTGERTEGPKLNKVASLCVCLSVLMFNCYSAISFLTICILHRFQLLGTEPEDFGVNWKSSNGPLKVKGLSAPGKLARQQDSCGKIDHKKQVSFADHLVSFVSSGTMAESVTETLAV